MKCWTWITLDLLKVCDSKKDTSRSKKTAAGWLQAFPIKCRYQILMLHNLCEVTTVTTMTLQFIMTSCKLSGRLTSVSMCNEVQSAEP